MRETQRRVAEQGYPTFEDPDAAFKEARATNQTTPDDALRHRLGHILKQTPDGRWTYKQDPRAGYYWDPSDLWDELPKVQAPVLIVRGGKSMVLSDSIAEKMRAAFPNAQLFTSAESGHHVPEDTPDLFIQAMEEFLAAS